MQVATPDVLVNALRAKGYSLLRDGALDTMLDKVYADYTPYLGVPSFAAAYGWFGTWFIHWHQRTAFEVFGSRFADIVISNAARKSLAYQRKELVYGSEPHSTVGSPGAG